jgi:hypothetical protein
MDFCPDSQTAPEKLALYGKIEPLPAKKFLALNRGAKTASAALRV